MVILENSVGYPYPTKLYSEFYEIPPPPRTGERWINIYSNHLGASYYTKEDADNNVAPTRIACVKVTWTEGQFDE